MAEIPLELMPKIRYICPSRADGDITPTGSCYDVHDSTRCSNICFDVLAELSFE